MIFETLGLGVVMHEEVFKLFGPWGFHARIVFLICIAFGPWSCRALGFVSPNRALSFSGLLLALPLGLGV